MRNLVRMTIFDDADHLSEKHPGVSFCEISFFFKPGEEFSAIAVATYDWGYSRTMKKF